PGFFIGGIPNNFGQGFRSSARSVSTSPFVIEGDEYDTAFFEKTAKFLHYTPHHAIITSLEHDHIDIYPNEASYVAAFERFVRLIPADGLLVAHSNDASVSRLTMQTDCAVARYAVEGFGTPPSEPHVVSPILDRGLWEARNVTVTEQGCQRFWIYHDGKRLTEIELNQSGKHNVANALGAFVLCHLAYGCSEQTLARALFTFN